MINKWSKHCNNSVCIKELFYPGRRRGRTWATRWIFLHGEWTCEPAQAKHILQFCQPDLFLLNIAATVPGWIRFDPRRCAEGGEGLGLQLQLLILLTTTIILTTSILINITMTAIFNVNSQCALLTSNLVYYWINLTKKSTMQLFQKPPHLRLAYLPWPHPPTHPLATFHKSGQPTPPLHTSLENILQQGKVIADVLNI